MILRRISVERYGCFGTAEFEFRRGLNLISGSNDSGKSLLLKVLPAVLLGVQHGARLRTWGDSLSCRATLLFEDGERQVRIQRDLENDLVRLEERRGDEKWRERFCAPVPLGGASPPRLEYFTHLRRLFGVGGEVLLQSLLDPAARQSLCDDDGRLADGLFVDGDQEPSVDDRADDQARRREEIAALEAEIEADSEQYQKGEEYLIWIRKRWETEPAAPSPAKKKAGGKADKPKEASLPEQLRDELARQLAKNGVPLRLPADLDELFAAAEGLRQELAGLQLEITPLQRSRQGVKLPGLLAPLLLSLIAAVPPAVAFWLKAPWLIAAVAGSLVLLAVAWGLFLARRSKANGIIADFDGQIAKVELKRADALARQEELAERFAAYDLPSTPVEMVKLQQLCQRHADAIQSYRSLCAQLGAGAPPAPTSAEPDDGHLRPEDLPGAEAKLAALGESLRQREARLQALKSGAPLKSAPPALPADAVQRQKLLLHVVSQQLERLTAGRYRELRLEEGLLRLEAAPGRWAAPAACGRGTAETLTLALRMALCQLTGARLPLPVDDLPASLDPRRLQVALRALERFAAEHQLLLANSDDELAKRAAREHWLLIDLNQPALDEPAPGEEKDHAGQLHLL